MFRIAICTLPESAKFYLNLKNNKSVTDLFQIVLLVDGNFQFFRNCTPVANRCEQGIKGAIYSDFNLTNTRCLKLLPMGKTISPISISLLLKPVIFF